VINMKGWISRFAIHATSNWPPPSEARTIMGS
jgi:hypothetical protein